MAVTSQRVTTRLLSGETAPKTFGTAIVELGDGSLVVAGRAVIGSGPSQPLVAKLTATGDLIWLKALDVGSGSPGLGRLSSGDVLLTCPRSEFPEQPVVLRVDPNGQIVWQRRYPLAHGGVLTRALARAGGGAVLVGHEQADYDVRRARILRIDDQGMVVWERRWGRVVGNSSSLKLFRVAGGSGSAMYAAGLSTIGDTLLLRVNDAGDLESCPGLPGLGVSEAIGFVFSDLDETLFTPTGTVVAASHATTPESVGLADPECGVPRPLRRFTDPVGSRSRSDGREPPPSRPLEHGALASS